MFRLVVSLLLVGELCTGGGEPWTNQAVVQTDLKLNRHSGADLEFSIDGVVCS